MRRSIGKMSSGHGEGEAGGWTPPGKVWWEGSGSAARKGGEEVAGSGKISCRN